MFFLKLDPLDLIDHFFEKSEDYRKYFYDKLYNYLSVDLIIIPLIFAFLVDDIKSFEIYTKILLGILGLITVVTKLLIVSRKLLHYEPKIRDFWLECGNIRRKHEETDEKDELDSNVNEEITFMILSK